MEKGREKLGGVERRGKTLSVTPGSFGLDVPGEAGVAPSRWRGVDWPEAAERLQQAAQQPHRGLTASRSQKGALQRGRSHPEGRAPLKSRERDPHFLPLLLPPLSPPPPSLLPPPPPSRVGVSLRPTGQSSSESSFPRSLPLASLTPTPPPSEEEPEERKMAAAASTRGAAGPLRGA